MLLLNSKEMSILFVGLIVFLITRLLDMTLDVGNMWPALRLMYGQIVLYPERIVICNHELLQINLSEVATKRTHINYIIEILHDYILDVMYCSFDKNSSHWLEY